MELSGYDLVFSSWVLAKLDLHGVTELEVEEAFGNARPRYKEETRARHRSRPPTLWFIAPTAEDRLLKVIFIAHHKQRLVHIKSAYEPDEREIEIYGD